MALRCTRTRRRTLYMYMSRPLQEFGIYSPSYRRYLGTLGIVLMTPSRYIVQEPLPTVRFNNARFYMYRSHCMSWAFGICICERLSLTDSEAPSLISGLESRPLLQLSYRC